MTVMKTITTIPAIMIHHSVRYLRADAESQRRKRAAAPAGEKRAAAVRGAEEGLLMTSLSILHPRVYHRVQQVHHERHPAHEQGIDHDHPLDGGIIPERDAVQEETAHTRP